MSNSKKVIKLFKDDTEVRERHARAADHYAAQVAGSTNKSETINQCITHLLMSLRVK